MPQNPTVPAADYAALASFRHALSRFLRFSALAARKVGLTPQQHQALLALKGFPGEAQPTIGELAERLQLRHNSTVGLADRLERRKFVRRIHDQVDRRVVRLVMTEEGEAAIAKLSAVHREELRREGPELRRRLEELTN